MTTSLHNILQTGEVLIAKQRGFRSGSIGWFGWGVSNAYDLYLAKGPRGDYVLIVFMKLQFVFHETPGNPWSKAEKKKFVADFQQAVNSVWGNMRLLKSLSSGKKVRVDLRFDSWIEGWSISEHWEVSVTKIKKRAFRQSSVNPIWKTADLDSEDLRPVRKQLPRGVNQPGIRQRGVVHEFGHMLGLPDEYKVGTLHATAYRSIMNRGEIVRNRHDAVYMKWLNKILKEKGIN